MSITNSTAIEDRLHECAQHRVHALCVKFGIREPAVHLTIRGPHLAGEIDPKQWLIRLNLDLFTTYEDYFISDVIPHELCHLWMAQLGFPEASHGPLWRRHLQLMGCKPSVRHKLIPPSHLKGIRVHCGCTERILRDTEVALIQNGYRLSCPDCHTIVQLEKAVVCTTA